MGMHNLVGLTADQVLHERRCCQSFWRIWNDSYQDNCQLYHKHQDEWDKSDSGPFLLWDFLHWTPSALRLFKVAVYYDNIYRLLSVFNHWSRLKICFSRKSFAQPRWVIGTSTAGFRLGLSLAPYYGSFNHKGLPETQYLYNTALLAFF